MSRLALAVFILALPSCGDLTHDSGRRVLAAKGVYWVVHSDRARYVQDRDGWFHISETRSEQSFAIVDVEPGDRDGPSVDLDEFHTTTDTDLPDRALGDFDKLRLTRDDGQSFLDARSRATIDGEVFEFDARFELTFTRGDWFDYEAGNPVSFRLSPEGMETAKDTFKQQIESMLLPIVRADLISGMKGMRDERGGSISDADIGRLAYVETEVMSQDHPDTEYHFDGRAISYTDTEPLELTLWIGMGLTSENFRQATSR